MKLKVASNDEINISCTQGGLKWWNRQKLYSRWLEMMKSTKVVAKVVRKKEIGKSCAEGGFK